MSTNKKKRKTKPSLTSSIRKRQSERLFPVIAEIKVRSEKVGDLLKGRDPIALARMMASCPVAGISVVTEPRYFGGSMELLQDVSREVDLPVLRKDFIVTEEQVEESATCGAQAILLITAHLELPRLTCLIDRAKKCGLETMVEVHSVEELKKIEPLTYDLLGINNRDITILEVDDADVGKTEELAPHAKRGNRLLISESAISSPQDVIRAARSGADAVLVGTSILKAERLNDFLLELIYVGWPV